MPMLLLRPAIFAVVFFAVAVFINTMVTHFLPELLEDNVPDNEPEFLPGSKVNIVEGDTGETPLDFSSGSYAAASGQAMMGAQPEDTGDDVGDISALASLVNPTREFSQGTDEGAVFGVEDGQIPMGLDHNAKSGYNAMASVASFSNEVNVDSDEMLPDLDSMAGAFVSSHSQEEPEATEYSAPASSPPKKLSPRTKGSEWAGDFNAKDIAAGLRTVLKREKEG